MCRQHSWTTRPYSQTRSTGAWETTQPLTSHTAHTTASAHVHTPQGRVGAACGVDTTREHSTQQQADSRRTACSHAASNADVGSSCGANTTGTRRDSTAVCSSTLVTRRVGAAPSARRRDGAADDAADDVAEVATVQRRLGEVECAAQQAVVTRAHAQVQTVALQRDGSWTRAARAVPQQPLAAVVHRDAHVRCSRNTQSRNTRHGQSRARG